MFGLLVSAPTCKECRNHHFCLKRRKIWTTWKPMTFLGPIREVDLHGKLLSQNLEKSESRESQMKPAYPGQEVMLKP